MPDDPSKVLGGPMRPYGERSRFGQTVRQKSALAKTDEFGGNQTPLAETPGIITPSALHYEVHRGGVPDIDPRKHRLLIHGLVDRPVVLTMEEIKRLPSTSRILFLECQGNTQREWQAPTGKTVQQTHGTTSCSEWTGVPLSVLLREVGVQKDATWIIAEGADATGNERSIPIAKAMDDVLVAYSQNGEAVRPENGYPLRLIVPGWTGNINVKWLRRLKVVDRPYLTRMDGVGQPTLMPDGKARQLQFVMEAKSVITFPSGGQQLPGPGSYEITGLAWSGRGLVHRSRSRRTMARPGGTPGSRSPSCATPILASGSTGDGTGARLSCNRGAPTRPAMSSRRWPHWSGSAAWSRTTSTTPSRTGRWRPTGASTMSTCRPPMGGGKMGLAIAQHSLSLHNLKPWQGLTWHQVRPTAFGTLL